jgi:uncharacterized protein (DUF1800 family)
VAAALPEGLRRRRGRLDRHHEGPRLDIANNFAERVAERIDPNGVVETALGPIASAETRAAVARAESRQQALALAFMSPEFQRR